MYVYFKYCSITHDLSSGKKGTIQFSKGDIYAVKKNKAGTLIVVSFYLLQLLLYLIFIFDLKENINYLLYRNNFQILLETMYK